MFSLAVSSGSNPAPSSIIGEILPFTSTVPVVGLYTPLTTLRSVLFPAPLAPIIPTTSPLFILKSISFNAQK